MIQGENSAEFNKVLKDIPKIRFLDVIKDAHIRKAFAKFNETQVSTGTFMVVSILISLCAFVYMLRFRSFIVVDHHTRFQYVASIVLTSVLVFTIVVLWVILFLKINSKNINHKKRYCLVEFLYSIQPMLQVILPIMVTFFYGLQLILRVLGGQCEEGTLYLHTLMCNPNHSTNGLPEETLAQLMLTPIVFHILLRDSFIGTFLLSWIVSIGSIATAAVLMNIKQVTPFLVIYIMFSCVIHYDHQRQNLSLFFLAEKLKYSLSENERLADETHASELRHMIANVAHDLKTPLTSFLSGVEFITQIVMDWDERLSDPSKSLHTAENVEFTSESLSAIHGCLESIRNTNSFMIMTINRCIDFTKASKGLKLIPKLETIDLQETVDLPIKVMRDFKSNLAINMLPIASDICTHLISDRQWLQENLLCLMSNAVKYSSKGTIEICVTLVTLPIIKPESGKHEKAKPSPRKRKTSMMKIKIIPSAESGRSTIVGSPSHYSTASAINYGAPNNHSNNNNNNNNNSNNNNENSYSGRDSARDSARDSEHPDSVKMRKLSNFAFNHDYSTMGRSRIFSEKMLADINKEEEDAVEPIAEEEESGDPLPDEHGLFLRIEVQDTGIGLSDEAMQSLFTPFKQAQRLAGGTGLGLYSLAKRIEALCGHYGVSHRRDGASGSLFWFAIPYRPDVAFAHSLQKQNKARSNSLRGALNHAAHAARIASLRVNSDGCLVDLEKEGTTHLGMGMLGTNSLSNNSLPSENSVGPSTGRPSSGSSRQSAVELLGARPIGKLSILLVDDSLSILKMTTMMLKRSGHKVEQADNGAEGLDTILRGYEKLTGLGIAQVNKECPYDVVLMDLQMPVMDGLESVRRLRAAEKDQLQGYLSGLDGELSGDEDCKVDDGQVRSFSKPSTRKLLSSSTVGGSNRDISQKTIDSNQAGARAGVRMRPRRQFVIGVSANSDHETMLEAMKAGFDAFIGKPFSIDAFYEVYSSHQSRGKEKSIGCMK